MCPFQIRVDGIPPPAENALLYETVTVVEGKPILRDMVFSPDHQYIYLLSDRQVNTPAEPLHDKGSVRERVTRFFFIRVSLLFILAILQPKNDIQTQSWQMVTHQIGLFGSA